MKKQILAIALLLIVLVSNEILASVIPPTPGPQDTQISILLVADTRLTGADVDAAIANLEATWSNTDLATGTPTTIHIVNFGVPIPAGESVFSGDPEEQIGKIRLLVEAPVIPTLTSLRDFYAADVVIGLSSDIDGACGVGPQDKWIGFFPGFSGNAEGLDLREANDDYIAVAQLSGHTSCRPYLAAHEFGHLLGGGHWGTIHNVNGGLLSNSKPWKVISRFTLTTQITAMGRGPQSPDCTSTDPAKCIHIASFSDPSFGNPNTRMSDTINMTARSVANYRIGGEMPVQPETCSDGIDNDDDNFVDAADSDCGVCSEEMCPTPPNIPPNCDATVPPVGVIGWIVQICVPNTPTATEYQVVWAHACPQAVSEYEVWAAQPTINPFTYRWSVVPPFTRVIVWGSSARVKVRSCGIGGCSALSSSSFLAVDRC